MRSGSNHCRSGAVAWATVLLGMATPAHAEPADAAPLAASVKQPSDPCAPVRRISPEFGDAFATFAAADATAVPAAQPGIEGFEPPLEVTVAARPPWQPEATGGAAPARPFLASKLLPTRQTSFDRDWRRVRDVTLSAECAAGLIGQAVGKPSRAMVQAVNRWANRNVRYAGDAQGDRWADAAQTLRMRLGDCEDLAILKLQLLAALGMPWDAMYLTLVRDLIRRRDHAVLVVRLDGSAWMLDDATETLLDARLANDYKPVMSFSGTRKWLHGK